VLPGEVVAAKQSAFVQQLAPGLNVVLDVFVFVGAVNEDQIELPIFASKFEGRIQRFPPPNFEPVGD